MEPQNHYVFKRSLALKHWSLVTPTPLVSWYLLEAMAVEVRFGSTPLGCTSIRFVEFSRPESGVRDLPNILVRKFESVDLPRFPFGQVPVGVLSRDCMMTETKLSMERCQGSPGAHSRGFCGVEDCGAQQPQRGATVHPWKLEWGRRVPGHPGGNRSRHCNAKTLDSTGLVAGRTDVLEGPEVKSCGCQLRGSQSKSGATCLGCAFEPRGFEPWWRRICASFYL